MKKNIISVCAILAIAVVSTLNGAEAEKQKKDSPEFARLKTLVGTWEGKADMGKGPIDMTVQYRLIAGGSVLEERVFAGTPHEMVTMYYEKDGQLGLTHYCVMGNRPGMLLKSSNDKTIKFDFDATCGINVTKESHMHGLTIQFDDSDTITTSCKAFIDGKEVAEHPTTLKRVKAS